LNQQASIRRVPWVPAPRYVAENKPLSVRRIDPFHALQRIAHETRRRFDNPHETALAVKRISSRYHKLATNVRRRPLPLQGRQSRGEGLRLFQAVGRLLLPEKGPVRAGEGRDADVFVTRRAGPDNFPGGVELRRIDHAKRREHFTAAVAV